MSAPARSKRPSWRGVSGSDGAADHEHGEADRHVDEQHPAPRHPLGEHAAGDQADGGAADRDGGVEAERPRALAALGEHRREQGERRRGGERAADALRRRGRRAAAAGRARTRRRSEARMKIAMPARKIRRRPEHVAGAGAEQQQAAEGQRVGVEHPGQVGRREAAARCWMSGSATFTMVASSTTISWQVRMTEQDERGRGRAVAALEPSAPAPRCGHVAGGGGELEQTW